MIVRKKPFVLDYHLPGVVNLELIYLGAETSWYLEQYAACKCFILSMQQTRILNSKKGNNAVKILFMIS